MARRTDRTDFDDFDDFDTPGSGYQSSSGNSRDRDFEDDGDDWAGSSRTVGTSRRRRKGRTGVPSRLIWIAVLAICILGAAVMMLGGDETPSQLQSPTLPVAQPTDPEDWNQQPEITFPVWTEPQPQEVPTLPQEVSTQPQEVPTLPQEVPTLPPAVQEPVRYGFYGQKLDARYLDVYDQLYRDILNYEPQSEGVILTTYEELHPILDAIMKDHAELFWFRCNYNASYYTRDGYVELTVNYEYDIPRDQIPQCIAFVEGETQGILSRLQGKSEYEKVRGVYDFLIDRTIYDLNYRAMTIYDFLYHGRGVCEGYARMTQYLLEKLGIEVIYVVGEADGLGGRDSHAWNILKVEGEYYQLDTTWGDPVNENEVQTKNYNYFLVTDREMALAHYPERYDLPACTATACNYYQRESNYLVSFDYQTLYYWMIGAANRGIPLEFKCANKQVYEQALQYLFHDGHIWDLMEDALGTKYPAPTYSHNDDLFIIELPIEW